MLQALCTHRAVSPCAATKGSAGQLFSSPLLLAPGLVGIQETSLHQNETDISSFTTVCFQAHLVGALRLSPPPAFQPHCPEWIWEAQTMHFRSSCLCKLLPPWTHQPQAVLEPGAPRSTARPANYRASNMDHLTCSAAHSQFSTQQRQAENRDCIPIDFSPITPFPIHTDPNLGCTHALPGSMLVTATPRSRLTQPGTDREWHRLGRARAPAVRSHCAVRDPGGPARREELMLTAHLSCPLAHCSRRADSEQTSHRTSSNFTLGFIFGVRALRAPPSPFQL